jgi:type VI secretion system secreted protein VgrG
VERGAVTIIAISTASRATLGSETLCIDDYDGAFDANVPASINFTQPGAVMKVDSIDPWRTDTRWSTNAIEFRSWDYRAVNDRCPPLMRATPRC